MSSKLKLSRKRPLLSSLKDGSDISQGSDKKKGQQTKISKFFSRALLPSLSSNHDAKQQQTPKTTVPPEIVITQDDGHQSDPDLIERTPEAAEKGRYNRFCRLKKNSKGNLSSSKSGSSIVTSTPTSVSPPNSKRPKFESPNASNEDEISPVHRENKHPAPSDVQTRNERKFNSASSLPCPAERFGKSQSVGQEWDHAGEHKPIPSRPSEKPVVDGKPSFGQHLGSEWEQTVKRKPIPAKPERKINSVTSLPGQLDSHQVYENRLILGSDVPDHKPPGQVNPLERRHRVPVKPERKFNSVRDLISNLETPLDDKELLLAKRKPLDVIPSLLDTRAVHKPPARSETPKDADKPLSCKYGRHKVISVERPKGPYGEIHVSLENDDDKTIKECIIRGSWINTELKNGDVVNILNVSDTDKKDPIVIDDMSGILVVHPDHMLSGTSVVSSLFCTRKAVLNERFRGVEGNNRTMFVGTLVHILLQECLRCDARSKEAIAAQVSHILQMVSIRQDMLDLGMNEVDVRQELEPFLPHILFFIERYVVGRDVQVPQAAYSNLGGGSSQRSFGGRPPPAPQLWPGRVEAVKDIEENIWSPRLGIKGKVDITVQVKLQSRDKKGRLCKALPLELKTGRPSGSAEHRGQVIMYSMMMSERRPDPESGLLLYLRTSSLQEVQAGIHEMRGLIQLRNQLVIHLRDQENLPDPINLKRACDQCGLLLVCAASQELRNVVPPAPHAMAELVPQAISHLSSEHLAFFQKWSSMCALETGEALRANRLKKLWCVTPLNREANLSALANLKLNHSSSSISSAQVLQTFSRTEQIPLNIFHPGDAVIVSTDAALALSQGVVRSISSDDITISLDRDLKQWSSAENRFHVDKFEYQQTSGGTNLNNLARLLSNNPRARKLREIIVTGKIEATFVPGLPREVASVGKNILRPLNRVQQKAIFKTLMAEEYVLIRGMPGSGKTTAIVALIRLLVALGKSVLLTSYTHSAVDNVLVKLLQEDTEGSAPFLRVGQISRIHPDLLSHSAEVMSRDFDGDVTTLKKLFDSRPVVASTCLGINHPAISGRVFDYCIFDEAGQSLLLATLGPLFHCDKFVLVGDPQQLPPVVQSYEARIQGLEKSLFSHLESSTNVIPLTVQYRMNRDIQALANHLTYKNQLECGSEEVSERTLWSPDNLALNDKTWMNVILDTNVEKSVLFIDTSELKSEERTDEGGICNDLEAKLVVQIYSVIHKMSAKKDSIVTPTIGVIAPYRSQVSNLQKMLAKLVDDCSSVSTVDQFQGRDQDVIIYSCTRTKVKVIDEKGRNKSGDIMSDRRRLNVAVTRAKAKLIVVGHKDALLSYEPFKELIQYFETNDRIVQLKPEDVN